MEIIDRNKSELNYYDKYFLDYALEIAKQSTCIKRKHGAVIVKNRVIVSVGFNGAPIGEKNCIEIGSCFRSEANIIAGKRWDLCRAVHAEMNAIIKVSSNEMKGATIYVAGFNAETGERCESYPCTMCDKAIRDTLIERVIH